MYQGRNAKNYQLDTFLASQSTQTQPETFHKLRENSANR